MELKVSEILAAKLQKTQTLQAKKAEKDFSLTLSKLSEDELASKLKDLIDEITVCGNKLAEHMDIKDMKKYRGLVQNFINEVVTNSHKFSRENFLDRRGRHRVYGIVKLVNKELDELAQELLKSEKDHLTILEKTDEIRGLLLDIVI